jgi:hypothetical protein
MPSSKSDSPISEDVVWGKLSPKSRLNAYMPQKRKTSSSKKRTYNIPEGIDPKDMEDVLFEELETPKRKSPTLEFPDVPKEKPKRKSPTLKFPDVPTTPLMKQQRKLTVLQQFALKRTKLAEKTENQKKKNRTMREKLDALVNRFKKGGSRKSTFKKSGAKSTFRKSRAKRNRTRKRH